MTVQEELAQARMEGADSVYCTHMHPKIRHHLLGFAVAHGLKNEGEAALVVLSRYFSYQPWFEMKEVEK